MADRRKVSIALSSGGARGLAHIGVIEEILRRGHSIAAISGSSMGAFVGGLYAAGTMEGYKKWVLDLDKLDVFSLIDFTFSTHGFIKGEKVFDEMKKQGFIPKVNIEKLTIPLAIVAADIINNEEIVFTSGDLYNAVRASVSIPNVFTPIERPDGMLVDGGVLNPLPIKHVPKTNSDLIIAVDVNALIPYKKPKLPKIKKNDADKEQNTIDQLKAKWNELFLSDQKKSTKKDKLGYFDMLNRTIQVMQDKIIQYTIETSPPDILIQISKHAGGSFEFFKAKEFIEAGRQACALALDKNKL
jgi:NTE family protein